MPGDGREVSRRGLFGVFRRGARSLREGLDDVQRAHSGNAPAPPPASAPAGEPDAEAAPTVPDEPQYDRLLRPPAELAFAIQSGPAAWTVDLKGRRIAPGEDAVVRGGGLDEPLVLVRVHAHHWAACTGECPIDGSDILWRSADDLLRCPACGSAWRLDGESLEGPADSALARLVVDAYEGDGGDPEIRVYRP